MQSSFLPQWYLAVAVVYLGLAVLFNPIAQFHFPRHTWLTIDKVAFGLVLIPTLFSTWAMLPERAQQFVKLSALVGCAAALTAFVLTEAARAIGELHESSAADARVIEIAEDDDGERSYAVGVYAFTVAGQQFYGQTGQFDHVGDAVPVVYNPARPDLNHATSESNGWGAQLAIVFFTVFCGWAIAVGFRHTLASQGEQELLGQPWKRLVHLYGEARRNRDKPCPFYDDNPNIG